MPNNNPADTFWSFLEKLRNIPIWIWALIVIALIAIDVSQNPNCCTPGAADDSPPVYSDPNKGY